MKKKLQNWVNIINQQTPLTAEEFDRQQKAIVKSWMKKMKKPIPRPYFQLFTIEPDLPPNNKP